MTQNTTFSEREAIARIVDHEGYWERLDGLNHAIRSGLANDEQHMELCHTRDEEAAATKDSLEKADEILAIIARRAPAPPSPSPVTVTIPPLKPDQAEYIAKAVRREPVDMDTVIGASPVTGALVEALEAVKTIRSFPTAANQIEGRVTEAGSRLLDACCDAIDAALAAQKAEG